MNEVMEVEVVPSLSPTPDPQGLIKVAASAAKSLMSVARPVDIAGKKYLTVEDWQTIGTIYGVAAGTGSSKFIEEGGVQGYEAHAVVRRTSDGMVVSEAIGRCMREGLWKDREQFALASMAQTRAVSKALRNLLAWVVRLEGFETTPAEEITDEMRTNISPQESSPQDWEEMRNTIAFHNGKNAGKKWSELDIGMLIWTVENHKTKGNLAQQELDFRVENMDEYDESVLSFVKDKDITEIKEKEEDPDLPY